MYAKASPFSLALAMLVRGQVLRFVSWRNARKNENKNKPVEGYNVKIIKVMRITQSKWAARSNNKFTLKFNYVITLMAFNKLSSLC